jgi:hypothetical protein
MNEQDYDKIYSAVSEVLRQKEMLWVLEQVDEQIRFGKTESKEISPKERAHRQSNLPTLETSSRMRKSRRGEPEEFLVSTEYSAQEKLHLLIDAIEQSVVNANRMVQDTLEFVGDRFGISEIIFYSTEREKMKTFSSSDFIKHAQQISRLEDLLEELRRQANAD